MNTVSVGLGLQRSSATRRAVRKGYAQHLSDYDRRRRLSPASEETLLYKQLLRADPCLACGTRPQPGRVSDVDHIVPLNGGGEDDWTNMAAACPGCNRGRKDTPLLRYLLARIEVR